MAKRGETSNLYMEQGQIGKDTEQAVRWRSDPLRYDFRVGCKSPERNFWS